MFTRIVRVLVLVAALTLLLVPASLAAAPGTNTMVVQSPLGVNVRTQPKLTAPIVIVLRNGEQVTTYGQEVWAQGIRWIQVSVSRWGYVYEGYCASAYLANYPGYNEPIDGYTGDKGFKVISPDGLRLRSGPGLKYYPVRIVPYGTILERTGTDAVDADGYRWIELKLNGSRAWAAKIYLEKVSGAE